MKRFTPMPAARPPTLKTVATASGVALATASYALSGRKRGGQISPAVVARVRRTARRIGYVGNASARSLVSGRAFAVGLVVSGQTPYSHAAWGQFVEGMEIEIAGQGCALVIRHVAEPAATTTEAFDLMRRRVVDAVVLPCRDLRGDWPAVPAGLIPPVLVPLGGPQPACIYPAVTLDIPAGLHQAVRELAVLGHRRFLWLEPRSVRPERRESVASEIARLGHEFSASIVDARAQQLFDQQVAGMESLQAAVERALPTRIGATAILCWNDRLAFHVHAALAARGIRVPEDVSLVGFDDFIAAWTVPALSTVSARTADRAAAAARIALDMAERRTRPTQHPENVVLPARFISRATTGPASSSPTTP